MFKDELHWLKIQYIKYNRKPSFWIWEIVWLLALYRVWKYVFLLIFLLYFYTIVCYITNKLIINIDNNNKFSIVIGMMQINFLSALEDNKMNKSLIQKILFFQTFRIVFGISYKVFKITISLYDCLVREYEWSSIAKKKKKYIILKKFISRSMENFIFLEFIKKKPEVKEIMTFQIKRIKRDIKVTISN